jgi:F0F1-type ATP synthase membrane subunit a
LNDLDKSQYEVQKLKIQNENSDLKLQSKNNKIIFLFLTVGLVSLVVILSLQKKAKNKIYAELQLQTEQISNLKR